MEKEAIKQARKKLEMGCEKIGCGIYNKCLCDICQARLEGFETAIKIFKE